MFLPALYPELALFCGALIILMNDVFFAKNKPEFFRASYLIALLSCLASLYFTAHNTFIVGSFFHGMFFINSFTCFIKFVTVILLIFIIILSLGFLAKEKEISAEFLALLMISTCGGMFLISANDFLTFYLSLELQALPLYLLASINRKSAKSSESGMKYFILGSVASGLLLLGISLFYGFSGTTNFDVATYLYSANPVPPAVILGFLLIIIAMFFKISAAPFHMWTPDVYEGSNTIVTTFFATVTKFTATMVLLRLFLDLSPSWLGMEKVLILVAIASMAVGSFGAIKQNNIKRLLAYSSIGHVGFVVFALSALSPDGIKACVIYMVIYAILSLGNFGFLNLILGLKNGTQPAGSCDETDNKIFNISSFSGLAKTNPLMAAFLTILMFSTAGIPPLAGFFSKFYVIAATVKSGYYATSIIAVLFSVISAFYYLRLVKVMYFDEVKEGQQLVFIDRFNPKLVIAFVVAFNLLFLTFMKPLIATIETMLGF